MKNSNFTSNAVRNEVLAMQTENTTTFFNVKKEMPGKRASWELIAAVASIGAIIAAVFILSATGVINCNSGF